jgi:hypothetical protein
MTDSNYTHITLVVDRSGSMQDIRSDAEGAVNAYVNGRKGGEGRTTLLLADFDAPSSFFAPVYPKPLVPWVQPGQIYNTPSTQPTVDQGYFRVVWDGDINEAPKYILEPRGGTALYDAIGKSITMTGNNLRNLSEDQRPGKVLFVVQTDGQENSSVEYNFSTVKHLVGQQQDTYSWEFVFLGAGLDAAAQGRNLGFANVTSYAGSGKSYQTAVNLLGSTTDAWRSGSAKSMTAMNTTVDDDGTITGD